MGRSLEKSNLLTTLKLLGVVVGMFVFALYIMPPLYTLFCEITGLNGKTGGKYEATEIRVDPSRTITVQFVATNNENMPWTFTPMTYTMKVHPGEEREVRYLAQNPTQHPMVAQAVPSLVPFNAAEYFHKTECFCFNQQALDGGESAELPLRFIVDQDIPDKVKTITLSYTIFDVTERMALSSSSAP